MKKLLKIAGFLFLGIAVLGVVAVVVVSKLIDVEQYKPQIEAKLAEASGVPVHLGGNLQLSFFPWVGLSFSDLRIGNPEGFSAGDMVTLALFEAHLKVMPLLSKEVVIDRIVLDSPEIHLETTKQGIGNWMSVGNSSGQEEVQERTEEPKSTADGFGLKSLVVGEVSIVNGAVTFTDNAAGITKKVSDITLRLTDISFDKQITMEFNVAFDGQPFGLQGQFGPLGANPGQEDVPFDISLHAVEELEVQVKGVLSNLFTELGFKVQMEVKQFSPRTLIGKIDPALIPETSDPSALGALALKLDISGSKQQLAINSGEMKLDDSTVSFTGGLPSVSPPHLVFKGQMDTLDLDRYLPPKGEEQAVGEEEQAGTTPKVVDYGPFRTLVLESAFKVGSLKVHGGRIENIDLSLTGRDGLFNLEPLTFDLYQGKVETMVHVNVQGDKPKTKLDVNTSGIMVGPLLKDFVDKDLLEGVLESSVSLDLVGDTPEEIKKSLNGSGNLMFRDGAIVGIDLAGMVRNIQTAFIGSGAQQKPKTDFAELQAPFVLTDGLFSTENISLKSPLLRITVKGSADLVEEKLDMRIHPKFVATLVGQGDTLKRSGLMIPVIVDGTFQEPEFSPDVEEMVKSQVVDEGLDKVLEESGLTEKIVPKEQVDTLKKGLKSLLPKF
ncbi:AsmA family protein [Desulfopila sp. IMCC35008]|uniref:AsmA family protein n=1 Tax=Desulfopila sp. IMCC35008 TaxID=2653858 RepID=UPI0013CF6CC7|nr:AsmA family protein [Desulfopila sp. IMCC35008]